MARIRRCLPLLAVLFLLAGCFKTTGPFSDDFSDPGSGWGAATPETYLRGYKTDRYVMEVDVPDLLVWATPGKTYQDVKIGVTTTSEAVQDNHYGVLCRHTAKGEFYYFAISGDGYYAIFRRTEEGDLIPLTGQAMARSALIRMDGAENQILAVCEGPELALYVNGELVAQASDETLERGDVGLAAGTLDLGGALVWFDDFEADVP